MIKIFFYVAQFLLIVKCVDGIITAFYGSKSHVLRQPLLAFMKLNIHVKANCVLLQGKNNDFNMNVKCKK